MSEWTEYKLGDVINLKRGYDLPNSNRLNGKIPIYSSSGISDYHNEAMKDGPGVITGRYGTIGQVFYSKEKYWPLNTTLYVQDFKGNYPLFIYYFLKCIDFEKFNDKSAVPGINRNDVHMEAVSLPSLPEQTAIAEVLSSLDDKINLLHRQNKTLEQLAETLFRQWFVEEAEESWEVDVLDNIIELQRGISYSGSSLGEKGEGLPMHNLNSIDINGSYKYEGIKYYKGEAKEKQLLKAGDLLIINTDITQDNRIIGWPIFVPEEYEYSVSTHHLYSATLKNDSVSKLYLYYLLRHRDYREALANASNGTTVSMLSKEAIGGIQVKIPLKEKRLLFEEQVIVFQKKQTDNQKQIRTLTQLRDTLLPKLMSGEVRMEIN